MTDQSAFGLISPVKKIGGGFSRQGFSEEYMSYIEILMAANGSDVIAEVPTDLVIHWKTAQLKIGVLLEIIPEKDMAKKALRRSVKTVWISLYREDTLLVSTSLANFIRFSKF